MNFISKLNFALVRSRTKLVWTFSQTQTYSICVLHTVLLSSPVRPSLRPHRCRYWQIVHVNDVRIIDRKLCCLLWCRKLDAHRSPFPSTFTSNPMNDFEFPILLPAQSCAPTILNMQFDTSDGNSFIANQTFDGDFSALNCAAHFIIELTKLWNDITSKMCQSVGLHLKRCSHKQGACNGVGGLLHNLITNQYPIECLLTVHKPPNAAQLYVVFVETKRMEFYYPAFEYFEAGSPPNGKLNIFQHWIALHVHTEGAKHIADDRYHVLSAYWVARSDDSRGKRKRIEKKKYRENITLERKLH